MRRSRTLSPVVDAVEPRVLLSADAMLPAPRGLHGVVREVRQIMGTLARTQNVQRAGAELTHLSARIPTGLEILAPEWRADLDLYRPHAAGTVGLARAMVLADLYRFLRAGPGGLLPPPMPPVPLPPVPIVPSPAASLDSVTIRNETGLALSVTVRLSAPLAPYITQPIPAPSGSSSLFDFRSATGGFMTIDVIRADGIRTPMPLYGVSLNRPMGGYDGTLFTISLLGPYFNITPP